jgi:hypothetical protein
MGLTGHDCPLQRPSAGSEHCVRAHVVDREEVSIPIGDSDTGSVHVEGARSSVLISAGLAAVAAQVVTIGRLLLMRGRLNVQPQDPIADISQSACRDGRDMERAKALSHHRGKGRAAPIWTGGVGHLRCFCWCSSLRRAVEKGFVTDAQHSK